MSFTVETVPFDSTDQKDFVLDGWQIAAPLDVGSSWSALRIGMRYSITDAGASLGTGPELWFGLLSSPSAGMANGPLTTSTSHFVGCKVITSWTRATSPAIHYTATANYAKRVGSTNTDVSASTIYVGAEPTTIKQALIVQIEKGSPYVVTILRPTSSVSLVDNTISKDTFITAMNGSLTAALTALNIEGGGTGYAGNSNNVTVDEGADGALNSICIAWSSGIASLHASEAFFRVVA